MHSLLFNHEFIHITARDLSLNDDNYNQEIIIKRGTTSEFYKLSVICFAVVQFIGLNPV